MLFRIPAHVLELVSSRQPRHALADPSQRLADHEVIGVMESLRFSSVLVQLAAAVGASSS